MRKYKYTYVYWQDAIGPERAGWATSRFRNFIFEIYHPNRVLSSVTDGTPADQAKCIRVHFSENNVYCSVFEFLELADTFAVPSLDATLIV